MMRSEEEISRAIELLNRVQLRGPGVAIAVLSAGVALAVLRWARGEESEFCELLDNLHKFDVAKSN